MTPAQKRQAGRGAVGYVRVSSRSQRDNWSPETQNSVIRAWCERQHIPLIALVRAPDGWESGKDFDRVGWQEVERHLASGTVGWLVVAAVDRLSRDLQQLAEKVSQWEEQDVAVIVPSLSGEDATGVAKFLVHILGMLGEYERATIVGRVVPGLRKRLEAGLPLGRRLLGYRVVASEEPGAGHAKRVLATDPDTAPMVTGLFALALAHPTFGDRRLADLATAQWPQIAWSSGRIASILTNVAYTGTLIGSVHGTQVFRLHNHPALVSPGDFARVQTLRGQRATDRSVGIDGVRAISWLGGLARCGRCSGRVQWRSTPASTPRYAHRPEVVRSLDDGLYECRGTDGTGCGLTWPIAIENFVWAALERVLERERGLLHRIAGEAIDRLPSVLDERRQTASATLAQADHQEELLTESLAAGVLNTERYTAAIQVLASGRAQARAQLEETDGWTYLTRLLLQREGPQAGRWRWTPLQQALMPTHQGKEEVQRALAERRRILHAVAPTVLLQDMHAPKAVGSLDGPGEDPERGVFTGVTLGKTEPVHAVSPIALALARLMVHNPGYDVEAGLQKAGWVKGSKDAGEVGTGSIWVSREDDKEAKIAIHPSPSA